MRPLMKPGAQVDELVGAALARGARLYDVELFGFAFAATHFHLLARPSSRDSIPRFMQFVRGNIARKVGRLVEWPGTFWGRRYTAETLLDDSALLNRMQYLVGYHTGPSLLDMLKDEKPRDYRWRNWTKRWFALRDTGVDIDPFGDTCPSELETLRLSPLPCWATLSPRERRKKILALEADLNAKADLRIAAKSPKSVLLSHLTRPGALTVH